MKVLDKYILKSFLLPFFATFFIVLFVLIMQALWVSFENLAGKGIEIIFIFKFLYYTMLMVTPQALPIGVLLSSIMTMGNLSEHYEYAAIKSSGISLQRLLRPLIFLIVGFSLINFMFLNNIYPYAVLKQRNLYYNIKTKEPTMALIPGSFNTELPGFHIKFDEKYGEDKNLLKKVMIYDLTERKGNKKIITAEHGKIITVEGSRYMTLVLYNGHFFESHKVNGFSPNKKMPASYADFKEYEFNIDISSLSDDDLDETKHTTRYDMLNLKQVKDTVVKLKENYDTYLKLQDKKYLYIIKNGEELHKYPDSLINKNLKPEILDNFDTRNKQLIINSAIQNIDRSISSINSRKGTIQAKRKSLNKYDVEFYNRIALSFSCLILFFIGAPLGSIIRKGGFGLPMVLAISIYVIYHFTNTFGKNLSEDSSISTFLGALMSSFITIPFAILLTRRATRDKGLFSIDSLIQPIKLLFKKINPKKETTTK